MEILTVENLSKNFGEKVLFDDISFGISSGDKIGVIGVNGTGKSTLLKIIAGVDEPDKGQVVTMNGIKIGYLPQVPVFEENETVINQIFKTNNPVMQLIKEYEDCLSLLSGNKDDVKLNEKISELSKEIDKVDGWSLQSEAKTILTKLGISDFHKPIGVLSGGQRKRVAIASALISKVDLLILDEPTNHIDNETVDWLEKYFKKCTKALIMVTHDRYFLDRVVNKTIELDKGKLYTYYGNYSEFLNLKAEREAMEISSEKKRQNFLRNELEWVRRGALARSTKQKARLERFEQISNMSGPKTQSNVEFNGVSTRLGRKTIIVDNISKAFDGVTYIKDFSYIVNRNDRVGIIGGNGKGKSTLLKIMTGQILPDSGSVEIGETVKLGIFAQENDDMNPEQRVIDYIKDVAEYIETADGKLSASVMLEKFLFDSEMQWSYISKLSGGEKRRLYLLKVLMQAPNILFLDEPTNDLDIQTLSILEEYLDTFNGAVVVVSHDRYFLDKCVDRIFAFEDFGHIKQYEGGYTDYYEKKDGNDFIEFSSDNSAKYEKSKKKEWDKGERTLKMTYKEQREFETINDVIEKLENRLDEISKEIGKSESNYVKLQELTDEQQKVESELENAMDRWVYLNELNEKINEK